MVRLARALALTLLVLAPAALVRADDDDDKKALVFETAPATWKVEQPAGMMAPMLAFAVPAAEGETDPAKITVHHLGSFAGSVNANIKRWCSQFTVTGADGETLDAAKLKREKIEIAGLKTTLVELKGTYHPPSFGAAAKPAIEHALMIAAIVETPAGPHFVRFVGTEKTVAKNKDAFLKWLKSAKWELPAPAKKADDKPDEKKEDPKKADDKKPDDKKPEGK